MYYNPETGTLTSSRPEAAPVLTDKGFLAEGWVETIDPVTGKVTYYNKETGMRSDEPPVQAPDAETMATWAVAEDPDPDKGPLAAGWEVRTDPKTGEVMYYNPETGTLTSTRPEKTPPITEKGFLAEGWVETVDPVTGKVCYYNKETGMKSDAPPVHAPSAETMSTWEIADDPEQDKGPLAAGWEVRKDPVTGEVMYYNPETGALTSSRPEVAVGLTDKGFLAAGWEEVIDPVTGKVCYINKATGQKSDQPPVRAPSAEIMATWPVAEDPEADKGPLAAGWEVRK